MDPSDPKKNILKQKYKEKNIQMMNVVEDSLKYMSERQQKRAKAARKAFQVIGTPTTQDLKIIIRMNLIKNSDITTEDVKLIEKTFGPELGAIK